MKKWLTLGALFVVILVTFYYFHDRRIEPGNAQVQGESTALIVQRESEITRTPTDSHPEVSIQNPATADYIPAQRPERGTPEFQGETDEPIVQRKPEITRTPARPPRGVSYENPDNTTTWAKFGDYVLVVTQKGGFPNANGEWDPQKYGVDLDIKDKTGKNLYHDWSRTLFRFRHAEAGGSYVINSVEDLFAVPLEDVNGNGVPDLVFMVWDGGADCCYTTHVLELGKEFSVENPDNTTTLAKLGDYDLVVTQKGGRSKANGELDPQLFGVDLDVNDKEGKNLYHVWSQKFFRSRRAEAGGSYVMNSAEDFFAVPLEDVNGNGVPDLVFIVWSDGFGRSGDAHCCYTTHVLEPGKKFSVVWPDDVRHAGAELVDIDGDGDEEIVTQNFENAEMEESEQTTGPNHQSVVILASRWYRGVSESSKIHFDIFSLDRASRVWKRLAQDDGYGMAEILTADITGDGVSEIILSSSEGSGGFLSYRIYGFIGDELQGLKRTAVNKGFLGLFMGSLIATENGLLENSGERFTLYSWNGTTFIGTRVKQPLDPTYTGHVLHYSIQVTEQGERVVGASQVSMKVGETLRLVRDDLSDTPVRIMRSGNGVLVWVNRGEYKAVKIGETGFTIIPNGYDWELALEISVVVIP